MSELFLQLIEMALTRCAIPDEISKLELTAFARLKLVSVCVDDRFERRTQADSVPTKPKVLKQHAN